MARSLKKGPFVDPSLQRKVDRMASATSKQIVRTWSRRSMITPDFVGMTFHFIFCDSEVMTECTYLHFEPFEVFLKGMWRIVVSVCF